MLELISNTFIVPLVISWLLFVLLPRHALSYMYAACAVEDIKKATVVVSQKGSFFIPNFVLGIPQS